MRKIKTKSKIATAITLSLVITSFILSMIGFYMIENNFLQNLYNTVRIFKIDFDYVGDDINIYLQIARFLAPIAIIGFLISALSGRIEDLIKAIKSLSPKCYAITGQGNNYLAVKRQFADQKINFVEYQNRIPKRARNQIYVTDSERDLKLFLPLEWDKENSNINYYLVANTLAEYSQHPSNVTLCSLANLGARTYWRQYPINKTNEKIVIIGSGKYVEHFLSYAICHNVVGLKSSIQYYVFGDLENYVSAQHQMQNAIDVQVVGKDDKIIASKKDKVFFMQDKWQHYSKLLSECDRVIVVEKDDCTCIDVYNPLSKLFITKQIHIKLIDSGVIENSFKRENVTVIGQRNKLCVFTNIVNQKYNFDAKLIRANYILNNQHLEVYKDLLLEFGLYKGDVHRWVEMGKKFKDEWNDSSVFVKNANKMTADHIQYKAMLLGCEDSSQQHEYKTLLAKAKLKKSKYLELCEIEHSRWCRYYYMNNWTYNETTDESKKHYKQLIPFEQTTEKHRSSNWLNYEIISKR